MTLSDFTVTKTLPFSQPRGERLYVDSMLFIDATDRKLLDFDGSRDNHGQTEIAVPSRLRSNASATLPMSGIRVVVKDNFDLEDTRTSLCSRAYLQTYQKKLSPPLAFRKSWIWAPPLSARRNFVLSHNGKSQPNPSNTRIRGRLVPTGFSLLGGVVTEAELPLVHTNG